MEFTENSNIENDFHKVISEFTVDLLNTFPEYTQIIGRWWSHTDSDADVELRKNQIQFVMNHCKTIYPERFFDILYKNKEIFNPDVNVNTEFLPGIVFKHLWNLDISENTQEIIWKYLQLILFTIVGGVDNNDDFKDAAKLFEFIDKDELKQKIEETFLSMFGEESNSEGKFDASFSMPNASDINEHLNSLMSGKLGKFAMEMAEEAAEEFGEFDDIDTEDLGKDGGKKIFEKMFKNPTKMMNIIKNIFSKLDEKIKSGEIDETELMTEGAEMFQNLKNTFGTGGVQKMFNQFMGGGNKANLSAMESQLNRNLKNAKMKERMKNKMAAKKSSQDIDNMINLQTQTPTQTQQKMSDDELIKIFTSGEKPQKSMRISKNKQNKQNKQNKKQK